MSEPLVAWRPGAATGVGSMPGTDVREATRVVLGELPDLPHLPELPGRGAGADLVGRTLALLPGFAATTVPTGWRVTAAAGADQRRALSWLDEDLDAVEELAAGATGAFKVSLAGPLTLAAQLELASGERALRDPGAVRDLAASLAEAIATHVAVLRRRLPGVSLLVQLDEPSLPAVLAASIPTASGWATLRRVDEPTADGLLRTAIDAVTVAGAYPVVHSCASKVPIALLRRAGARAISLDASLLRADASTDQALGECIDAGVPLFLGVVPTDGPGLWDPAGNVAVVRTMWNRLGFAPGELASAVVVTPACGLGRTPWPVARDVLSRARAAGRVLVEDPEVAR